MRIDWRLTLERIEYDEDGKPARIAEFRQLFSDHYLHGTVLSPLYLMGQSIRNLYFGILNEVAEEAQSDGD